MNEIPSVELHININIDNFLMGCKYPSREVLQIYTTQILITVLMSNDIIVDAANIPQMPSGTNYN